MIMHKVYIFILAIFTFFSCKKVDDDLLALNKDILIKHTWGIPQLLRGSFNAVDIFNRSSTQFDENGVVFIGDDYEDIYRFLNENTIRFENTGINWQILSINDSILHVDMIRAESSEFLIECLYDAKD